jgi:protein-disulfide isomerase
VFVQINKLTLGAVAATVIGLFVLAATWYQPAPSAPEPNPAAGIATSGSSAPTQASLSLVRPHSPFLGPEQAAVTVVEFLDPECESCRVMYPMVKQLLTEFDGRMKLVIRYMPLHGNAVYASSLLEASREQNKYWEFLEIMMLRQPEWASHAAPRPDLLLTYAPMVGIDVAKLKADAENPQIRIRILQDQTDGQSLGVNGTPTFFINGRELQRLSFADLRAAIQSQLQ